MVGTSDRELEESVVADPGAVDRVAEALRAHNVEAIIVDTAAEVRDTVLAMIPDGAEVHWGKSRALEDTGLVEALMTPGRYDAIRPRVFQMDRETQGREIRKLSAAPDVMLGSVNAVTRSGRGWSGRRDSNPRHSAWEADTLPAELLPLGRSPF